MLGEVLLDNLKWDCNLAGTRATLRDAQPTLLDSGILTQYSSSGVISYP
ncbi:MAG: hypothetical protein WCF22_07940 [Candidatus Sulfotelmatobacter sp.]